MKKQGHIVKNWKTRDFVLTEGELAYYSGSKMKGVVYMDEVSNVRRAEGRRKSIEIITPAKTYTLEADDDKAADEWLISISETIEKKKKKLAGLGRDIISSMSDPGRLEKVLSGSSLSSYVDDEDDNEGVRSPRSPTSLLTEDSMMFDITDDVLYNNLLQKLKIAALGIFSVINVFYIFHILLKYLFRYQCILYLSYLIKISFPLSMSFISFISY